MNYNLNYEGFEQNLKERLERTEGIQYLFKFDNGYGASVVKSRYSYGHDDDLWELAVIEFTNRDGRERFYLTYETEITDDVLGWKTDEDIRDILRMIKEL